MRNWIDAGHGGRDPGAVNGMRMEQEDTLRLALEPKLGEQADGAESSLEYWRTRAQEAEAALKRICTLSGAFSQ